MPNDLSLLTDFAGGQGLPGVYTAYAQDHDANYSAVLAWAQQVTAELRAFQGADAPLLYDLLRSDELAIDTGLVGAESFRPITFGAADTEVTIPVGVALTALGRAQTPNPVTLVGTGSAGTRYLALSIGGSITLETVAAQRAMDLATVSWTGTAFDTGSLVYLEPILVDGDDFQACRIVSTISGSAAGLPETVYQRIANRLDALQLLLQGATTGPEGETLGRLAIAGSVAAPGIILGDGSASYDPGSGLYRPASNRLGVSIAGVQAAEFGEAAAGQPQLRARAGTALSTPPFAFVGDPDTGLAWTSADRYRVVAGGVEIAEARGDVPELYVPALRVDSILGAVRERLVADRDYFVRTDGNDANTGLANTAGQAFANLQRAIDVVGGLDFNGHTVEITFGVAGTYAGAEFSAPLVLGQGGTLRIVGDTAAPSSYVLSSDLVVAEGATVFVRGLDLTSSGAGLYIAAGGDVTIDGAMVFGTTSLAHILLEEHGRFRAIADYTIDGDAAAHIQAADSSCASIENRTLTLTGTPDFSDAFAVALRACSIHVAGASFSGGATGLRYRAETNGVIDSEGELITFLPGDALGTTATGGQFA